MKNYEAPEIVELGTADALVLGIEPLAVVDNAGGPFPYDE